MVCRKISRRALERDAVMACKLDGPLGLETGMYETYKLCLPPLPFEQESKIAQNVFVVPGCNTQRPSLLAGILRAVT